MLAVFIYDEKITIVKVISALMIFVGIYLVGIKPTIKKSA